MKYSNTAHSIMWNANIMQPVFICLQLIDEIKETERDLERERYHISELLYMVHFTQHILLLCSSDWSKKKILSRSLKEKNDKLDRVQQRREEVDEEFLEIIEKIDKNAQKLSDAVGEVFVVDIVSISN